VSPFLQFDAAAFNNRLHGAERQDSAGMVRHNHLLPRAGMPPLLMAACGADSAESMTAEDPGDLI